MASSYVTVGSGDHHVLAIHGWFGSARGWGSFPEFIDGSAYTYVFMDLRGYGDQSTWQSPTSSYRTGYCRSALRRPSRCCRWWR